MPHPHGLTDAWVGSNLNDLVSLETDGRGIFLRFSKTRYRGTC
jgi:hypothetical protein